jgi:hypothetical protein
MNKRYLPCLEKEIFAIGQENSIADCKEKLKICLECYNFITCQKSQEIFKIIENQQNNLINMKNY